VRAGHLPVRTMRTANGVVFRKFPRWHAGPEEHDPGKGRSACGDL